MNLFTKQKQTLSLRERTYGSQGERNRGRESQGVWDGHVHTAILKWVTNKNPCVAQGTLLSVMWQS